jgi:DNA-binding response OmpR family regulator
MLLDLGLRDVDGLEVASQVRMRHTLPIIGLSARAKKNTRFTRSTGVSTTT